MEEHHALERRKRDETLRRIQQERIKREKQRGAARRPHAVRMAPG
jgi:hypothetical protein